VDSAIIIWNVTGSYVTVGANAKIVGTVMARGYVSTGEGAELCGGAAYSATSYITVGANAKVGADAESGTISDGAATNVGACSFPPAA
jgi:hypothetical protein